MRYIPVFILLLVIFLSSTVIHTRKLGNMLLVNMSILFTMVLVLCFVMSEDETEQVLGLQAFGLFIVSIIWCFAHG